MTLVKKLRFFHLLSLSKIDREKVFADVLDTKEAFKDYKKYFYKKRRSENFPKGLVHDFREKLEISSTLIFLQNKPRKSI